MQNQNNIVTEKLEIDDSKKHEKKMKIMEEKITEIKG